MTLLFSRIFRPFFRSSNAYFGLHHPVRSPLRSHLRTNIELPSKRDSIACSQAQPSPTGGSKMDWLVWLRPLLPCRPSVPTFGVRVSLRNCAASFLHDLASSWCLVIVCPTSSTKIHPQRFRNSFLVSTANRRTFLLVDFFFLLLGGMCGAGRPLQDSRSSRLYLLLELFI